MTEKLNEVRLADPDDENKSVVFRVRNGELEILQETIVKGSDPSGQPGDTTEQEKVTTRRYGLGQKFE